MSSNSFSWLEDSGCGLFLLLSFSGMIGGFGRVSLVFKILRFEFLMWLVLVKVLPREELRELALFLHSDFLRFSVELLECG